MVLDSLLIDSSPLSIVLIFCGLARLVLPSNEFKLNFVDLGMEVRDDLYPLLAFFLLLNCPFVASLLFFRQVVQTYIAVRFISFQIRQQSAVS